MAETIGPYVRRTISVPSALDVEVQALMEPGREFDGRPYAYAARVLMERGLNVLIGDADGDAPDDAEVEAEALEAHKELIRELVRGILSDTGLYGDVEQIKTNIYDGVDAIRRDIGNVQASCNTIGGKVDEANNRVQDAALRDGAERDAAALARFLTVLASFVAGFAGVFAAVLAGLV